MIIMTYESKNHVIKYFYIKLEINLYLGGIVRNSNALTQYFVVHVSPSAATVLHQLVSPMFNLTVCQWHRFLGTLPPWLLKKQLLNLFEKRHD